MSAFLVRRIVGFVLTLIAASILIFVVLSLLGGDVAVILLGQRGTPEAVAALRHELGLDAPLWSQYVDWVGGMLHGDFGRSFATGEPVAPQILQRLPVTIPLALLSAVVAVLIAVPAGVLAAMHHRRFGDVAISVASQIGISIPAFWSGLLLAWLFAVRLGWLPSGGFVAWTESPIGALKSLALPVLSLGTGLAAILTRYIRSAVLEIMREDFIRTARAKGFTWREALWRHGLRNAAIPIITVLGIQLGAMLGGAIIIENVFFLPGLGRMIVQAALQRDLVLVQSTAIVLTAIVLAVNLLTDVTYGLLDPRMRVSSA